jgi:serine/threonine-protein kinase
MELVRGGDLDAALQAAGLLEWRRASRIIASAARGLGAAHAQGVVHRDVKPQNLLLADPKGDDVKVADFGLAKLGQGGSLTAAGSYLGTIGYLAPEQAMGEDVTAAADVFSLGVTWYRLLAGRHPFQGTASELLKATILQRVPDQRASVRDLPAPIAEILLAMTAREAADRPHDGAEVARRIDAALATDAAARARSG